MCELWVLPERVFDGEQLWDGKAVCIRDGIVEQIMPVTELRAKAARLPIAGLLTPGFVDLQVNGGGGVMFNQTASATGIAEIAAAHYRFGTVAIMPTVITDAPSVLDAAVQGALDAKDAAHFAGLHIEGPHIEPQKRGTHAVQFIRPLDELTLDAVKVLRRADVVVMITVAPEAATEDQIARLAGMGAIVSLGHSNCTAAEAQSAFAAGARCVTHLFNAMSQMQSRAPGLTGAGIASDAYVGMICDGIHVYDDMLALALRARPLPDRSFIVSDAMPSVGGPDHFQLYGQKITLNAGQLINSDGNLAGAHTTMAAGVARLVHYVGLPLEAALRMAITVPATLINNLELAKIIRRKPSELMIMDTELGLTGNLQNAIDKHMA